MGHILPLLFLLLTPGFALGAVAVDATSTLPPPDPNAAVGTFAHTITGSNTLLLCTVAGLSGQTITSYTYDGTPMSLVDVEYNLDSGSSRYVGIYKLATGTGSGTPKNAEVTLSGIDGMMASCTSFAGVDQTTPTGTSAKSYNSTDTAMPATAITIPAGGLGFDAGMFALCDTNVPGGSQTERSDFCNLDTDASAFSSTISSTGSQSFTWTLTGSHFWAQVAVPINAVGAPGGDTRRRVVVVQ